MAYLKDPRLWRRVLLTMFLPLALVAFWPDPVDQPFQRDLSRALNFLHNHGIPAWFDYNSVEASANVLLFVPLGIVASLAFPRKRWWHIGVFGLTISAGIESGQFLFLHNRFASLQDIVTNTGGAVIGALLAGAAIKNLRTRMPIQQRVRRGSDGS